MTTQDADTRSQEIGKFEKFAKKLGIEIEDAQTLVADIMPMLKRKFDLLAHGPEGEDSVEKRIQKILYKEIEVVLGNYGLSQLKSNKTVMLYVLKKIAPEITDLRAKQLVDKQVSQSDQSLADQLAEKLGVRDTQVQHFKSKVLPKLKKYTKSMYRNKIRNGDTLDNPETFNQFIIENVFIDEFENHVYIRSATDKNNRAILLPEANTIAMSMITAWMNEVKAEESK